ncbi:hypothetical protein RB195_012645 [Necator americanus]|uniref:Uncharacterized protein n=1 Tax=Necator americanus TaxID=51031 RepID=A0ABR1DRX7_NECAM
MMPLKDRRVMFATERITVSKDFGSKNWYGVEILVSNEDFYMDQGPLIYPIVLSLGMFIRRRTMQIKRLAFSDDGPRLEGTELNQKQSFKDSSIGEGVKCWKRILEKLNAIVSRFRQV